MPGRIAGRCIVVLALVLPSALPAMWLAPAAISPPGAANQSIDDEFRQRAGLLDPNDMEAHVSLAMWARERGRYDLVSVLCKFVLSRMPEHANAKLLLDEATEALSDPASTQPASRPARRMRENLVAPQMLSDRDINRLKLYELRLDGPPEALQVRFLRRQGESSIEDLARQDILARGEPLDENWSHTLYRGRPEEKLRLIVRESGLKYAERIDVRNHPEVFVEFRRRVLPLLARGCARGGCHTGPDAEGFRLPNGSRQSDRYLYTAFLLLAEAEPPSGPLVNRSLPEESTLLTFMLPANQTLRPHPATRSRINPVIHSRNHPNYQVVLDWINSLSVPKPAYELEYIYPNWLQRATATAETLDDAQQPAATQPARAP
jgi:hypothetical protein